MKYLIIIMITLSGCAYKYTPKEVNIPAKHELKVLNIKVKTHDNYADCAKDMSWPMLKMEAELRGDVKWYVFTPENTKILTNIYNTNDPIPVPLIKPDFIGFFLRVDMETKEPVSSMMLVVIVQDNCIIDVSEIETDTMFILINGVYI